MDLAAVPESERQGPAEPALYLGEPAPRSPALARWMGLVAPGVALAYVGRPALGVLVQLGLAATWFAFISYNVLDPFLPLFPGAVLALAWLIVGGLIGKWAAGQASPDYIARWYNNPLAYALIAIFCWIAPLAAGWALWAGRYVAVAAVESAQMYPSLLEGDLVWARRDRAVASPPRRGELVGFRPEPGAPLSFARVVATPGDLVRVDEDVVFINGAPLNRRALGEGDRAAARLDRPGRLAMVEENGQARYVIALARSERAVGRAPSAKIEPGQLFVLADDRALARAERAAADSRDVGPIAASDVSLRPTHVLWSSAPGGGGVRWDRIGWRVE